MNYLWYSRQAEDRARGQEIPAPIQMRETSMSSGFKRAAKPPQGKSQISSGFSIFDNGKGEPVKVTLVSTDDGHNSQWPDIILVGEAPTAWQMATRAGIITPSGKAFCASHNLPAEVNALVGYMQQRERNIAEFKAGGGAKVALETPVTASKTIKFKK